MASSVDANVRLPECETTFLQPCPVVNATKPVLQAIRRNVFAGHARFKLPVLPYHQESTLAQKMLIRIGHQDEVSISPLGTSLMERQLDTKRQEGTIGKAIGIESFALLELLREQLSL